MAEASLSSVFKVVDASDTAKKFGKSSPAARRMIDAFLRQVTGKDYDLRAVLMGQQPTGAYGDRMMTIAVSRELADGSVVEALAEKMVAIYANVEPCLDAKGNLAGVLYRLANIPFVFSTSDQTLLVHIGGDVAAMKLSLKIQSREAPTQPFLAKQRARGLKQAATGKQAASRDIKLTGKGVVLGADAVSRQKVRFTVYCRTTQKGSVRPEYVPRANGTDETVVLELECTQATLYVAAAQSSSDSSSATLPPMDASVSIGADGITWLRRRHRRRRRCIPLDGSSSTIASSDDLPIRATDAPNHHKHVCPDIVCRMMCAAKHAVFWERAIYDDNGDARYVHTIRVLFNGGAEHGKSSGTIRAYSVHSGRDTCIRLHLETPLLLPVGGDAVMTLTVRYRVQRKNDDAAVVYDSHELHVGVPPLASSNTNKNSILLAMPSPVRGRCLLFKLRRVGGADRFFLCSVRTVPEDHIGVVQAIELSDSSLHSSLRGRRYLPADDEE